MSQTINSLEIETRIRQRIHDLGSRIFTASELLSVVDDELRAIFTRMRTSGQSWGQDYQEVQASAMTLVESGVYEYQLPAHMADIQLIQGILAGSQPAVQIPFVPAEMMDTQRLQLGSAGVVWTWGRNGAIQIRGTLPIPSFRVWFIRAIGPMVYGTASAGSTTSLTINAITGAHKARADIYRGMSLEVTADSGQPANVGQIVPVSGFAGSVFSFGSPLPQAASSTTSWAIVVPIPAEYVELLIERVAVHLLARAGNAEEYALHQANVVRLEQEFERNITNRQTGEPRRVVSSRTPR